MPLKGQAKIDYQREYMRKLRLKLDPVRPDVRPDVQPNEPIDEVDELETPRVEYIDADGQPVYDE